MSEYEPVVSRWDRCCGLIVQPVYFSAKLFHAVFGPDLPEDDERYADWETKIRYRTFFAGLPSLAAFGILVAVTAVVAARQSNFTGRYALQATAALDKGDHETAALCLARLNELEPDNPEFTLQLARELDAQGQAEQATALIDGLLSRQTAYGPAEIWRIRRRLAEKPGASEIAPLERRLIVLRNDPRLGQEAGMLLSEIYLRSGRANFVLREPQLAAAAEAVPRLQLLVLQERARGGLTAADRLNVEKLIQTFRSDVARHPQELDPRVHLAQTLTLAGDLAGAIVVLREGLQLSPEGPFGKLLAELLTSLAGNVQRAGRIPLEEQRAVYREAVDAVERFSEPGPVTALRRGQLYRLLGEFTQAERAYLGAVETIPEARVELAELYEQMNRGPDAVGQWQRLRRYFDQLRRDGVDPSVERRRMAALAAMNLGEYHEAARWLAEPEVVPGQESLLAEIYVRWWDMFHVLETPTGKSTDSHFNLLLRGLSFDPRNAAILARLLAAARRDDEIGTAALGELQKLVVDGDRKAPAYVVLGSAEYVRGNLEVAVQYLEQAYRLDPQADVTLNNLAWVLATGPKPDLDRALKLAQAAVEITGGAVRTRETRLRILVKLGRWDEALRDAEACESHFRGRADFHRLAAEVYEHLKLAAPAEEHRKRAAELELIQPSAKHL
jgi:tetratricopeptide (TPR) repeat protein